MKKLIYENINLETKCSYSIYRSGHSLSEMRYLVYECDPDGRTTLLGEFSEDEAYALVRTKCK
jgi:hypothetical protein